MKLRQVALVAKDLDPVVAQLCEVLDAEVCFNDPGVGYFGLHNALIAIGDTFLEVVSPEKEGTTAGRLLDKRGGDGGYMALFETGDLAADRARLEGLGVRVVWEVTLDDIEAAHLHPRDVGAAIVSLDQPRPAGAWRWGGPDWKSKRASCRAEAIVGVEISADDPQAMAARWADVLGLEPSSRDGHPCIELDGGWVRVVEHADGRGEGITGFDLRGIGAAKGTETVLCGTRLRFV